MTGSREMQADRDGVQVPLVSVHMPVFDTERYLSQAVESILGQTFTDFEFIIINDGSTDGSLAILERYAAQDVRIRLVSRENRGIGPTRNEALSMARGEYFGVMDADDVTMPERFARQVEHLRSTPDCVAVGSRVRLIDPEGAPIREMCSETTHEAIDGAHMAGRGGALAHPASMIRRSVIESLGGYREQCEPAEDYDLFLRLAECGRLANLPEVLLEYRQHLGSAGYARRRRQREGATLALADAHARRGLILTGRPFEDVGEGPTASDHHRKWAWWALEAGYVATARKHALAALKRAPLSGQSWRTMLCAVRGH